MTLSEVSRESLGGGVRKTKLDQSKVSTFGAFVGLLSELGEEKALLDTARENLRLAMAAYTTQTKKPLKS